MQTFTGKKFYFLDPQPADVDILDIAHSLSYQCRYNGHALRFYSVAEHSMLLASYTEHVLKLPLPQIMRALLHDAVEAYVSDVPSPFKKAVPAFPAIEAEVEKVVMEAFGLDPEKPDWLREIDQRICLYEREAIMVKSVEWPDSTGLAPLGMAIQCLAPHEAEGYFMRAYANLSVLLQKERAAPAPHYDPRCPLCGPVQKKAHMGSCK